MICELYVMNDKEIKMLINTPNTFEEYLSENYRFCEGSKHVENEILFSMDKGWDLAKFLIKQNDKSKTKILNKLDGIPISEEKHSGYYYILSNEVIEINKWLSNINTDEILNSNTETINDNFVYKAEWLIPENWSYILEHVYTFQKAFSKAFDKKHGIIISIG